MEHEYLGLVMNLWHWVVEDGLGFYDIETLLETNYGYEKLPAGTAEKRFKKYFEDTTGFSVYVKCPDCGKGRLVPRSGRDYFVGCSEFPDCRFHAYPKIRSNNKSNKNCKSPVKLV